MRRYNSYLGQNGLMALYEVKEQLRQLMPVLKERYKVESLEIFGSYVRGEQTKKSDVDVLVTFNGSYSLWQLIDVERFLKRKLHMKVDLVPRDSEACVEEAFCFECALWASG